MQLYFKDSKLLIVLKFEKGQMILLTIRTLTGDGSIAAIVGSFIEPGSDNYSAPTNHCLLESLEDYVFFFG